MCCGRPNQVAARTVRRLAEPMWELHMLSFDSAGVRFTEYPYYDRTTNRLGFEEMIVALAGAISIT